MLLQYVLQSVRLFITSLSFTKTAKHKIIQNKQHHTIAQGL